ncbi:MAG: zinc-dependent alcohol dehydrogenase family protein [Chloroflexota bacterium]|nr:zinc-dependent alcohol dehydrogenase family protein [Chloroflexota bacterium]
MEQLCAVWYGKHDLRLERRRVPELGPRDVLVEVALCGVCGTDVLILEGEYPLVKPPRVLGHEFSGTVRDVGSSVSNVKTGDPVAIEPSVSCGACFYCHQGLVYMCDNRATHHGGLGELVVLPEQTVYPLPAGVSLEVAALAEPLSCCLHTVDLSGIRPGDRVAVVGAGTIGLMLLQLARRAGATRILVSEPSAAKREIAQRLGADVVVDPLHQDVQAAAREMCGGRGVDVAIEAVGARQTVMDAIALPRRGGTVVLMGVAAPTTEVPLRPFDIFERELTIKGAYIREFEFQRTVELLSHLELDGLITDRFPLSNAAAAVEHVKSGQGIKTVVEPR